MTRQFIPWDGINMALSKSGCHSYEQCPYRFKLQVIDGIDFEKTEALAKGIMWHDLLYELYDKIDMKVIEREGTVEAEYSAFLPDDLIAENFIKMENQRLEAFIEADCVELFWPVLLEQYLEDRDGILVKGTDKEPEQKMMFYGTLDRLDRQQDGTYVVIDYKTGKFHQWMMSKYRFELMGYKHLIEKNYPKYKVTHGCLVFVQQDEIVYEKIGETTQKAFYKKVIRVRKRVKAKVFTKKVGPLCDYCSYVTMCLGEGETGQVQ